MTTEKPALFFAPLRDSFQDLCASAQSHPKLRSKPDRSQCLWKLKNLALRFDVTETLDETCSRLADNYYHLVLIDCRHLPSHEDRSAEQEAVLHQLLDHLQSEPDQERRYPFQRVIVLVGDEDEERVDQLLFSMGKRHVGACVRDLSLSSRLAGEHREEARTAFLERLLETCRGILEKKKVGKKALCLSGGGITGIYYELGVLKCLQDAMDFDLADFDIFAGISAGAVVAGCLANGYSIDELLGHVGRMEPLNRYRLQLSWQHLNISSIPRRVRFFQRDLSSYVWRLVKREDDLSLAGISRAYATLLGPIFDNKNLEQMLAKLFSGEGRTNDFRELDRELYIGTTDQDLRKHVLFGDEDLDHVPISQAIQASAAVHPFFPSVEIEGRFYTDGVVTRTSNMTTAIRKGADLVFVADPFVPLISEEPGFNARHGNLWIIEQDFKTVAFTRFRRISEQILRQNSHVSAYTFVPSNRMRRLMSQNPFVARNFHPIVCEAYRSTARRLHQMKYRLQGDLAAHRIDLDLDLVNFRVEALRSARKADVRMLLNGSEETEELKAG